jgi:putative hydrolase of the HAD superfamily
MIEAFIFDIGNVLLPFDFAAALQRLGRNSDVASLAKAMAPVTHAYEAGGMGRPVFLEKMREILRYQVAEAEFIAAWEDIFTENAAMTLLVGALHSRYPLFLLSNTNDLHMDYVRRKYPVFGHFKDGVYSYSAKCFKPERQIYEIALEQFGVEACKTAFIDDLQPNLDTALELGFQAIRYDFNRHEDLVKKLSAMGVATG